VVARGLRFGIVGGLATLTHGGVSVAALRWGGLAPLVANACGFAVAFCVSFCGHAWFTFRTRPSLQRALRFIAVAASSAAVSSALVLAAQAWTSLAPGTYLPLAALFTPACNFVLHSLWTFRHPTGKVR
jgi:putative flippase GtrA